MKKTVFLLVWLLATIGANAQQATVTLAGTEFNVLYDRNSGEVEIRDHEYVIHDNNGDKYDPPHWNKPRKFKNLSRSYRTVEVPETVEIEGYIYKVTSIGRAAFAGFQNVEEVKIPASIRSISDYAFFYSSIERMRIPETVVSIGKRVFGHCPKLKQLWLPTPEYTLDKETYAESKKCTKVFGETLIAGAPTQEETPKAWVPKQAERKGPSDVDIDIPSIPGNNETMLAFIVANENYRRVSAVNHAKNDGRKFREYCLNVLSIPEENIFYAEDATLNNMQEGLGWISDVAQAYKGKARILVYYAGHGVPDESTRSSYLLPVDGISNNVNTGLSLDELYATLGGLPTKDVTVFLDACFSGATRDGLALNGDARAPVIKAKAGVPKGKMVVFAAAQEDQTANTYNEQGHGLFTYYLLKMLKERKGDVTYGELSDYISEQVHLRSVKSIRKKQTPITTPSATLGEGWKSLKLR